MYSGCSLAIVAASHQSSSTLLLLSTKQWILQCARALCATADFGVSNTAAQCSELACIRHERDNSNMKQTSTGTALLRLHQHDMGSLAGAGSSTLQRG